MMFSLGDLAMSFSNRVANLRIRAEMNTLATELTTQRKSDIRTPLAGDLSPVAVIERSLSNLSAYETVISETTLFVTGAQAVLLKVTDGLSALAASALDMDKTASPALISNFAREAKGRFETLVSTLNTPIAGRSLFAGDDTASRPVADPDLILDDLVASLPPGALATDVSAVIDAYFAPGAGFDTARYLGSSTAMAAFRIAPEDSLSFGVTAQSRELRAALSATAKAAILDRMPFGADMAEQGALIRQAGLDLFDAEAGVVALRGSVGILERRLNVAQTRNSVEADSLEMARSAIVGADPFQTATRLQSVQMQLETFYTLTARLSQLNLTRYLR